MQQHYYVQQSHQVYKIIEFGYITCTLFYIHDTLKLASFAMAYTQCYRRECSSLHWPTRGVPSESVVQPNGVHALCQARV